MKLGLTLYVRYNMLFMLQFTKLDDRKYIGRGEGINFTYFPPFCSFLRLP
jgi:hypothetical protein